MKQEKIKVNWVKNMEYQATIDGHLLTMDIPVSAGGNDSGIRPKPLLLAALAGCTGMDVASLAKKMRVTLKTYNMDVEATEVDGFPATYDWIHITYNFEGEPADANKMIKMVELSQERYCGVSAMLMKAAVIAYSVRINDELIVDKKKVE